MGNVHYSMSVDSFRNINYSGGYKGQYILSHLALTVPLAVERKL